MWLATELGVRGNKPKRFPAWLACACLALPSLVHADEAAPNAQALGVAESALNYCGPIDPAAADRVRQMIKLLVQGASDRQLAQVRSSDGYRKAYDSVGDSVAKIDPHKAKRFCAEASTGGKIG
jgi:hypothetical protein